VLTVDVAIIGSGPCGLGAAWQLEQHRKRGAARSYVVIDETAAPGGSASSVTHDGFTFDLGGHVLFVHEHYAELNRLLDELVPEWHESIPIRGVWTDRRLIPYPVQRNIHRLPARKMLGSLMGLSRVAVRDRFTRGSARQREPGPDLESHLRSRFGHALTRAVLGPLNAKMWAHEPRLLASSWAAQRSGSATANVAEADIPQILRSILTRRDNPGWTAATRVRYPLRGGSGAIWSRLAARVPPERMIGGNRVVAIDSRAKTLTLRDGTHVRYGHLVSTIPLDVLLRIVHDRPELGERAPDLRYSRVHVTGFGLRGAPPPWLAGVHSFHLPQSDIPCWRINFPGAFSPGNVPSPGHWSILCETSSPADGSPWDTSTIAAAIEAKLVAFGIVPRDSTIVSRWEASLEHGYPVPFLGRDEILQRIQAMLRPIDILSRGRFGGWKYEVSNQDHTFMQGVEAIDFIITRRAEETYRFPELVN
jgi:protoporphyrinogen oxidase